jgi:hypothetical protein
MNNMNNFESLSEELIFLSSSEATYIDGGKGWMSGLEIAVGVVCVGVAIAAEMGTAGLATVPATTVASAGVGMIVHGAATL